MNSIIKFFMDGKFGLKYTSLFFFGEPKFPVLKQRSKK